MELQSNNHSVFCMRYQLILMSNKLKPVISDEISNRLYEIFEYISPNYNIKATDWEYRPGDITVTFIAHPKTELSKFINAYKSASSRLIKKDFTELIEQLDEGQFWSKTFCLLTLGCEISEDNINQYMLKLNPEYVFETSKKLNLGRENE